MGPNLTWSLPSHLKGCSYPLKEKPSSPQSTPSSSSSNLFKIAFKHRIHTAYKSYIHKKNVVLASRSKNSKSKAKALTKQFLKTWSHPSICSLDDDDIISINVFENAVKDKYQKLQSTSHTNTILRWAVQDT